MKPGQSRAEGGRAPARCRAASSRPNRSAAAGAAAPGLDPLQGEQLGSAAITSGTGDRAGLRAASQPGRLGGEEALRLARPRVRPGLGEDRRAVVQGQPGRRADAAAAHRRLPDALMGQERRQVLRVRAQVRQVHAPSICGRLSRRLQTGSKHERHEPATQSVRTGRPITARAAALWAELTEHHRRAVRRPEPRRADPGAAFEEYLTRLDLSGIWVAEHAEEGVVGLVGLMLERAGRRGGAGGGGRGAPRKGHR